MMQNAVIVSEIIEQNGKSVKENNMQVHHVIPIGAIVEIIDSYNDYPEEFVSNEHGIRLFVVSHDRDCDGTPLYGLSFNRFAKLKHDECKKELELAKKHYASTRSDDAFLNLRISAHIEANASGAIIHGYSESSLIIVKNP